MHGNRIFGSVLLACFLTVTPASGLLAAGWIGVTIEPPRGVQVGEIIKHGPADKAGLVRGDIIRKVDGQEVITMDQFIHTIRSKAAGTTLVLNLLRNGQEVDTKVTLEESWEHQSVVQAPLNRLRPDLGDTGSVQPRDYPNQFPPPADWGPNFSRFPREQAPEPVPVPPSTWLGIAPTMAQGGVGVQAIAPGSPGEKAGLKTGDIIVSINGQALATPQALVRLLGTLKPGDVVEINLNRDGQAQTVQAMLGTPPATPPASP